MRPGLAWALNGALKPFPSVPRKNKIKKSLGNRVRIPPRSEGLVGEADNTVGPDPWPEWIGQTENAVA